MAGMNEANKRTPICRHCKGNGYSGGIHPKQVELDDACEVCFGSGHVRRGFLHARTVDTKWGLGLAFLDMDTDEDREVLVLQLWAPVAADGSDACVSIKLGLPGSASMEAHDLMGEANREALEEMTPERFEAAIGKMPGIVEMLESAFERKEAE